VIRCPDRKILGAAMAWRQGQSYSKNLRARVLAAVDGGMAARAAASVFRVSVSYIYKALIRRRRTGETSASSRRGHRPRKLTPELEAAVAAHIVAHPDITLTALQTWLAGEHAVRLSNGAMWFESPFPRKRESRTTGVPLTLAPRLRGGDEETSRFYPIRLSASREPQYGSPTKPLGFRGRGTGRGRRRPHRVRVHSIPAAGLVLSRRRPFLGLLLRLRRSACSKICRSPRSWCS